MEAEVRAQILTGGRGDQPRKSGCCQGHREQLCEWQSRSAHKCEGGGWRMTQGLVVENEREYFVGRQKLCYLLWTWSCRCRCHMYWFELWYKISFRYLSLRPLCHTYPEQLLRMWRLVWIEWQLLLSGGVFIWGSTTSPWHPFDARGRPWKRVSEEILQAGVVSRSVRMAVRGLLGLVSCSGRLIFFEGVSRRSGGGRRTDKFCVSGAVVF